LSAVSLSKREIADYYGRFYLLSAGLAPGALAVEPVGKVRNPRELIRADRKPRQPVRFRREDGSRPMDLIPTTWADLCLVSERVIAVLEEGGFSGWTTFPVEITGRGGKEVPGYHGLAITGRCGAIDNSLTPKQLVPPDVPEGEPVEGRIGVLFEHGSWDGSDLFCTHKGTFLFVTEAGKDALGRAKLSNVALERITEIKRLW
jgi:hypothetical protein